MSDGSEKNQANAQLAKTQRLDDAKQALAEYEAAALATRAKTERLRALRLARDATSPPQATKRKSAPAKKGKTGGKSSVTVQAASPIGSTTKPKKAGAARILLRADHDKPEIDVRPPPAQRTTREMPKRARARYLAPCAKQQARAPAIR